MALKKTRSVAEAFSPASVGVLELDGVTYPVPPLTLETFYRLHSYSLGPLLESLGKATGMAATRAKKPATPRAGIKRYGWMAKLWAAIRGRRLMPWRITDVSAGVIDADPDWKDDIKALGEVVAMLVPTMPRKRWDEYATPETVCELIRLYGNAHDWNYIGSKLEPSKTNEPELPVDVALVGFCDQFPGNTIPALMALRVEGFFRQVDASVDLRQRQRDREDVAEMGGTVVSGLSGLESFLPDPDREKSVKDRTDMFREMFENANHAPVQTVRGPDGHGG